MMDIGEVAKRAGVPPSTLRYYEQIGLIRSFGRRGLRRQFDPEVLSKLSLIALGRTAGFPLNEIAAMFGHDGRLEVPRDRLRTKADELQRQMAQLRLLRDTLRHVADCKASSHLECLTFRKLMKAARRMGRARNSGVRSGY